MRMIKETYGHLLLVGSLSDLLDSRCYLIRAHSLRRGTSPSLLSILLKLFRVLGQLDHGLTDILVVIWDRVCIRVSKNGFDERFRRGVRSARFL